MQINAAAVWGGIIIIVKICGITSVAMAKASKEFGADLIGLVFADSRRKIDLIMAKRIVRETTDIGKVGLFVNSPLNEVQDIAKELRLDFVQLHGDESAEYCGKVVVPVIKAVRADFANLTALNSYPVEWILLDSFSKGHFGGSGVNFDWVQMQKIRQQISKRLMIAGGLNRDNVKTAIRLLRPNGVDVSSGVEKNGEKNRERMQQFINAAREGESLYAQKDC